jgi:hypothetical protein
MITKKVIDELYHKYRKPDPGIENLNIELLMGEASEHHDISIDEHGNIVISSIDTNSPFHKIALHNIRGITQFENDIAVVMHSSIVFLDKNQPKVNIHLRLDEPSFWDKIKAKF